MNASQRYAMMCLLAVVSTNAMAQRPGGKVQFMVALGAGLFGFLLGVLFGLWLCKRRHKRALMTTKGVDGGGAQIER